MDNLVTGIERRFVVVGGQRVSFEEQVSIRTMSSVSYLRRRLSVRLFGWGEVCGGVTTVGPWESADIAKHISEMKLLCAFNALRSFANDLRSCSVLLKLDNTTAVSYINKLGGTRSEPLRDLALTISTSVSQH